MHDLFGLVTQRGSQAGEQPVADRDLVRAFPVETAELGHAVSAQAHIVERGHDCLAILLAGSLQTAARSLVA